MRFDRYELVPRHLGHGRHHAFVERRLADQITYVKCAGGNFREHLSTEDFEVFHAHCCPAATTGYAALDASKRQVACSPAEM